jgi:3-oxoacyl-[acyl-carrier-protein] synthase-3
VPDLAVTPIVLAGLGLYLPDQVRTSDELARRAGVDRALVEDFLGVKRVFVAGPDDHPAAMGVAAARVALEQAGVAPAELDLILYVGSDYTEHVGWTAALKVQKDLGATRAVAFDVNQTCTGLMVGMHLARSLMRTGPGIETVLLAGGERPDHADPSHPWTTFLTNASAAGGAMVLRRGPSAGGLAHVLETHLITDGSVSEEIVVPAGGSKQPMTNELRARGLGSMTLLDAVAVGRFVSEHLMANTALCARRAVERSGRRWDDVRFLATHQARIDHQLCLLEALGLDEDQTVGLVDFGHLGPFDVICALKLGVETGRLCAGDLAVCAGAGIGFSWAATALEWTARGFP